MELIEFNSKITDMHIGMKKFKKPWTIKSKKQVRKFGYSVDMPVTMFTVNMIFVLDHLKKAIEYRPERIYLY